MNTPITRTAITNKLYTLTDMCARCAQTSGVSSIYPTQKSLSDGSDAISIVSTHTDSPTRLVRVDTGSKIDVNTVYTSSHSDTINTYLLFNNRTITALATSIHTRDTYGNTYLHLAAKKENTQHVKDLIQAGADINATNIRGFTPVHYASTKGTIEIIELLLNGGATVNTRTQAACTALHFGSWNRNIQIAKLLLARGADIHAQDSYGLTPLHIAVFNNRVELVELLISKGADGTKQDTAGCTPLHYAIQFGLDIIVRLLIQAGNSKF